MFKISSGDIETTAEKAEQAFFEANGRWNAGARNVVVTVGSGTTTRYLLRSGERPMMSDIETWANEAGRSSSC